MLFLFRCWKISCLIFLVTDNHENLLTAKISHIRYEWQYVGMSVTKRYKGQCSRYSIINPIIGTTQRYHYWTLCMCRAADGLQDVCGFLTVHTFEPLDSIQVPNCLLRHFWLREETNNQFKWLWLLGLSELNSLQAEMMSQLPQSQPQKAASYWAASVLPSDEAVSEVSGSQQGWS